MRLSRFTLKSDNTLDMTSEKSLLKILGSKTDQWHCGGPMAFDSYGDLWIAVGNNSPDLDPTACNAGNNVLSKTDSTQSAEWGPSDTHNMRGSFLRIHPDNSAKGYSVPSGNFGEYWADQFERQGNATLAAQYRDTTKVLPEIYVKGERSNFSIAVHPTKRWLAWGTVNYASNNDEFTITDHPIFSGFPYFMQNNVPTCSHGKSVSAPTNESPFNGGVKTLPPATPGTLNNIINVAIGGPIYSFDPTLKSTEKFPPHFDNKWIVAGFGRSGQPWDMWAVTLDDTKQPFAVKDRVSLKSGLFKNVPIRNFIGAAYGKDGALYILNYDGDYNAANNPGLVRVTYTGACQVVSNKPRPAVEVYQKVWFDPYGIMVGEKGAHSVSLYDMAGQRVWSGRGDGPREYKFSALRAGASLKPGLYLARVNTSIGEKVRTVSIF
jgi:cytochrome c